MYTVLIVFGILCLVGTLYAAFLTVFIYDQSGIRAAGFVGFITLGFVSAAILCFYLAGNLGPQCLEQKKVDGDWICLQYETKHECIAQKLDP